MILTPGTPSAYLFAIAGFGVLIAFFAGVATMLVSGFFFDIGYAVEPLRLGGFAALVAGVLAVAYGSWASWQDYHLGSSK